MNIFKSQIKKLIENKEYDKLNKALHNNLKLANEGITIPFDFFSSVKAHPLHRICDAVFAGKLTAIEAIKIANIFLDNGANIDGDKIKNEETPLIAAASLNAEKLGIFYIENDADVNFKSNNDGASALHWAAYCGKDILVDKLLNAHAVIDMPDTTYNSTPLGWAIQALKSNDNANKNKLSACIKLLLHGGADIIKLDEKKRNYLQLMANEDIAIQNLLA